MILRIYDHLVDRLIYSPLFIMADHTKNERWFWLWRVVALHRSGHRLRMKQGSRR